MPNPTPWSPADLLDNESALSGQNGTVVFADRPDDMLVTSYDRHGDRVESRAMDKETARLEWVRLRAAGLRRVYRHPAR